MAEVVVTDLESRVTEGNRKSDLKLAANAERVLRARYLKKDEQGRVTESPRDLFRRVATFPADSDSDCVNLTPNRSPP